MGGRCVRSWVGVSRYQFGLSLRVSEGVCRPEDVGPSGVAVGRFRVPHGGRFGGSHSNPYGEPT